MVALHHSVGLDVTLAGPHAEQPVHSSLQQQASSAHRTANGLRILRV
jgi:hypothetical protein